MKVKKQLLTIIQTIACIQAVLYFFGFINQGVGMTTGHALVRLGLHDLGGWLFWSLVAMLSIVGLALTLYLLIAKLVPAKAGVGLILCAVGFGIIILFTYFMLVPATLLVLGVIFNHVLLNQD